MRDLDDSDLTAIKKKELIKLFLEKQSECTTLKRSNNSYRSSNTRLSKELAYARQMWANWRKRFVDLKEVLRQETTSHSPPSTSRNDQ